MQKTTQDTTSSVAIATLLVLLAALSRLLPHPMNFTPVLACALFAGSALPARLAVAVPLAAMFLSDLALGFGFGKMSLAIYSCLLASVALGRWMRSRRTWQRTLGATLAGSTLFFVATNFLVWLGPVMAPPFNYEKSLPGLLKCYAMALPFWRNALAGDVAWTLGLFGAFDAARAWADSRHGKAHGRLAI